MENEIQEEASGKKKPEPNFASVYCCLYPDLVKIARVYGYALCVHGSLARDMDLVAVPWTDSAQDPEYVVKAFCQEFALKAVGGPPTKQPNGRLTYTLALQFGECFIDLSFMAILPNYWEMVEHFQKAMDENEKASVTVTTPVGSGTLTFTPRTQ